ncbi:hypothetical protein PFISCL1PPCAC_20103 [Pristionchus fissidentatus]|uniref:Uncharacterized protein n=1 Tax=Pristionchus fissidentatus TaxID=1538716 RepID=A0AAV5WD73_9BILA|nr:hypothetical protein PFISCL1PPCAC_20103 [Pristionchus fissidentatus]
MTIFQVISFRLPRSWKKLRIDDNFIFSNNSFSITMLYHTHARDINSIQMSVDSDIKQPEIPNAKSDRTTSTGKVLNLFKLHLEDGNVLKIFLIHDPTRFSLPDRMEDSDTVGDISIVVYSEWEEGERRQLQYSIHGLPPHTLQVG